MRVLLVEEDGPTAARIGAVLRRESFVCHAAHFEEAAREIGRLHDYDILLLDLQPPDLDGYEFLQRLRPGRVRTPILILSPRAELGKKINRLGFGADDVLTDPFDARELVTRIHATVRRAMGHPESTVRIGKLVVDLDSRTVMVGDEPVRLTGKEFGVLELLSLRKGAIVTKEMLLNHLYGGFDEPEMRIIDTFIGSLRRMLAAATGSQHYNETVWGRGYVLHDPSDRVVGHGSSQHWNVRRKAEMVAAIANGEITLEEALQRYRLSEEEFHTWRRAYEDHGLPGLRTTRLQQYRRTPPRRSSWSWSRH
jgi:two-component system, cell cycle response regulator CtrA